MIRTAFIYNPAKVAPVGASRVLTGSAPFANAREPLAQAFKAKGVPNTTFAVIVNHFKSKSCGGDSGDNVDARDGQGCFNGDRTRQASALTSFANDFAASRGTNRVFLTGDFNSYTQEDPMRPLYDAGYKVVESDTPDEWSYSFSGLSGSLDHVLASPAAMDMVSGADIWEINANESLAFEYSRHNYNVTDFYQPNVFRASDHNPEIVGHQPAGRRRRSGRAEPAGDQRLPRPDQHQHREVRRYRRAARRGGRGRQHPPGRGR